MDSAPSGAGGLRRGDHACLVCDSDEDRWRATLEFTRAGLARGERTLCVARTGGEQEASARLGVLNPVRADQLVVAPAAEAMGYAGGLPFDSPSATRSGASRCARRSATASPASA